MSDNKTATPKICIYNPEGVLCSMEDIKKNRCKECGWNPKEYKRRVMQLRGKSGKKV